MVRASIKSTLYMLPFLDGETLHSLLDPVSLIAALQRGFAGGVSAPPRAHVSLPSRRTIPDTLLMMPAWNESVLGIKLATIHPANGERELPAVHASYVLKERQTGRDLVLMDGTVLTRLRTAASSALASTFLSRPESSTLLMIGAGSLALPLIEAHCSIRPISRVLLWNRSRKRAESIASSSNRDIVVTDDLEGSCGAADIICCATLSSSPLVLGASVQPGTHVDLVGAYRPDMRESDAELINQAAVFVDTMEGARKEAGDLLLASAESNWTLDNIDADLSSLCRGHHSGRTQKDQVTVFKSVGASLEDLVAAELAWTRFLSQA